MALAELSHIDRVRKLAGDALVTFPGANTNFKRVERVHRVDRGTAWPTFLTADGEYTTEKLIEQYTVGGDKQQIEVYRNYETIPGATFTRIVYDETSDSFITVSRRKQLTSGITEAVSFSGTTSTTVVTSEEIDNNISWEVTTITPASPHNSEGTAKESYFTAPYGFPGYVIEYPDYGGLTYTAMDFFGETVGVRRTTSLTTVHRVLTWWEISATKPVYTADEVTTQDIVINNKPIPNILCNATTRVYSGVYTVTIPASVPTMNEYYGTMPALASGAPPPNPFTPVAGTRWIGTEKTIKVSVENDGNAYRWKIQKTLVVMR